MSEPLIEHKWRKRLLVVFAGSEDDERLAEQKKLLEEDEPGFEERDLFAVYSPGGEVRREFGVEAGTFAAILVGKDGREKVRFERPVEVDELFRLIDAMPMRRREVKRGA